MAEVETRGSATRGRSSTRARGGRRGGFGSRAKTNGTNETPQIDELVDDQGQLGEMRKQFASELSMLKDVFPDWKDVDLLFALQETGGDVGSTVDHITQGSVSQFAEVKSTKDRARSRAKDEPTKPASGEKLGASRGRGRGNIESTRGGRGRGDRGRGVRSRASHTGSNGTRDIGEASVPTTESTAWDTTTAKTGNADNSWDKPAADSSKATAGGQVGQSAWANVVTADTIPSAASEGVKSTLLPEGGAKKSWASMFAQPKPASVPQKPAQIPTLQSPPADLVSQAEPPITTETQEEQATQHEVETPAEDLGVPEIQAIAAIDPPDELPIETTKPEPLTEENLEALPDVSRPPPTQTSASTAGTADPRNLTPLPSHPAPIGRPPTGGYATTAARATGGSGRSASFQRRVQEQLEAVVMPGHNAVDRAVVQFGSMGLNGEPGLDVDEDREDPETRQAPQHSPPSQPRTSLPPAPRQAQEPMMPDSLPTPKQAPGLPPASQQNQQQVQNAMNQAIHHDLAPMSHQYGQFGGYGQSGTQQDGLTQQKPYDTFGQQPHQNRYDQYGSHAPASQPQTNQGFGGLSSAAYEYPSYQTADAQRNAYGHYYGGSYGPQDTRNQGHSEAGVAQQRASSGFGANPSEPSYGSHAQQQQVASRYGETPGSGNNTPNPLMGNQQPQPLHQQQGAPSGQSQPSVHQQGPSHQQQGAYAGAGFPYGHPYYNSPYQQAYQNQFGYNHHGYGGSFPGKQSNMYGGSQGYGLGPQSSYEQHSSSSGTTAAFGQNQAASGLRNTSGMGSLGGLEDYGRSSAQPSHQSSGFGGMSDTFARSGSGFGAQGGYGQQNTGTPDEALKAFNEPKGGPSPALGQPGRPGSAANNNNPGNNNIQASNHTGLPPGQSQSGFSGNYGGFPGQGNQYGGGLGGLGSHGQSQNNMGGQGSYGGYGGFGQAYGGYGSRGGGWGQSYGAH